MTIELHCFGESGHSYKAALGLTLAGLDWSPVKIDFFAGASRGDDFRALNAMGEAPVLIDGDTTLSQSGVILQWITDGAGVFGGTDASQEYEILRWTLWDNHKLSSHAGALRFMTNFLAAEKRSDDVIGYLGGRARAAYETLDRHLTGREWIVGNGLTRADLSCCSYLYYPEHFGFDRADWPGIDAWLDRISALPGWKHPYDLMPRALPGA